MIRRACSVSDNQSAVLVDPAIIRKMICSVINIGRSVPSTNNFNPELGLTSFELYTIILFIVMALTDGALYALSTSVARVAV